MQSANNRDLAVAEVKVPLVGSTHSSSHRNAWDSQSYAEFAEKAIKLNPEFKFDKEKMDELMQRAIDGTKTDLLVLVRSCRWLSEYDMLLTAIERTLIQ